MLPGITIRQLEAFYWCVRLGSFSAAAKRLNTSQPAISGRIRDIEVTIRGSLFERVGRSNRLTTTGRDLFPIAERYMDLGEELARKVRLEEVVGGSIRVGAADTVALTWLPRLLTELSRRYPRLDVELVIDLSVSLRQRLARGDLDIAFLVGGITEPEFASVELGSVENAWMCGREMEVPEGRLTARDLAGRPILTHTRGSHLHRIVEAWFEGSGARPTTLHGCNSLATMIQLTASGLGISVLPPGLVAPEISGGILRVLELDRLLPSVRFVANWPIRNGGRGLQAVADLACSLSLGDSRFRRPEA